MCVGTCETTWLCERNGREEREGKENDCHLCLFAVFLRIISVSYIFFYQCGRPLSTHMYLVQIIVFFIFRKIAENRFIFPFLKGLPRRGHNKKKSGKGIHDHTPHHTVVSVPHR